MLEELIADKSKQLGSHDISKEMRHLLKRNLIDSYSGICASLVDRPLIKTFKRYAETTADSNGIQVWGTTRRVQLVHGIFMNGILGRRSDLVNTYLSPNHLSGNHPSDNISLLLTLGGWKGIDGRALLQAMYLAYMLSCAFSDYYCPEAGGFDHDATAGFYTSLVAGHLLRLDRKGLIESQRIVGAMGLNTNQAALGQVSDWKHCTYASCAMHGTTAAMMAQAGFHGPVDIYQGQAGADRFFSHIDGFLSTIPDLQTITFKRWQALVFCQTAIDVALDLSPKFTRYDLATIDSVDVWTYAMALKQAGIAGAYHPDSQAGRTHSLPYCIAAALLFGTIDHASFDNQTAQTQQMQQLMKKIALHEDKQMSAEYPAKTACRIQISVADDQQIDAQRDYPHGAPQDPLHDDEITAKALTHLAPLVPNQKAEKIIQRLWNIENEQRLDWLLAPLTQEIDHG